MSSKSNELIGFLLSHYPIDEKEQKTKNSNNEFGKKIEKFSDKSKTNGENTFISWIKKNILIVLLFILLCILYYKTHVRKF